MKKRLYPLLLALCFSCTTPPPQHPKGTEETATTLAQKIIRASGGDKLSEVAQLNFTFVYYQGEQKVFDAVHKFDLKKFRARVTWTNPKGIKRDGVINLKTKTGTGSIDGVEATGEAQTDLVNKIYARWINDAYWLLMPLKLLDSGVALEKESNKTINGKEYQILKMTFGGVGLTPGDTYWLYINPKTNHIERWDMKLQGSAEVEPVTWEDYRAVGPLLLAFDHKEAGGRVVFEAVEALKEVNEKDFQ
jgi:Family of unknown function (DUF6503)